MFFFATVIWTLLVLTSLLTQRDRIEETAFSLARTDAIANLTKDMAIRQWASGVGGVYIREEFVPPFNSLEEEQRVTVQLSNGESFKLVKVTPIHLLLAIQQTSNEAFGIQERLTSKQLRNIENAPDEWEDRALEELSEGGEIYAEAIPGKRGHGLMRVMIPMRMEEECLECHRDTLVPKGALRGGAAIQVDLNAYRTAQEPIWRATQSGHLAIWLLGLVGILIFYIYTKRRAAEQMRVEEVQRENEAAFAAMDEGAVITDPGGRIMWVNDAACRIFELEFDALIGQSFTRFLGGVHTDAFYESVWAQLREKGHWRGEIWNRKKSGEIFPEEVSVRALMDDHNRVRRYISILSDISDRKKTEKELAKYREHLEELVKQRTEELTVARNQAEAANRSKSMFLANMNHELRTPLNAVIGFSQLMEKDKALSPKQQCNAEIINASASHLLTLINDILELSKIESGKVEMMPEEVVLADLLEQVVGMMRLRAEQADIMLNLEMIEVPPVVMLDSAMLRQVLLNLVSNAVKFTPGGRVDVRVRGYPEPDDEGKVRLAFSVADTGVGISAEDQERIFSPFEQAGPSQQGGTGLGLTISREYVDKMGGKLRVDSKPEEGSTFYFDIVAEIRQAYAPKPEEPVIVGLTPEEQGRRVLIIDDIPEARLLVRSLLEPFGFIIEEAGSVGAAEKFIARQVPDLILLDWFLPDRNGLDFLKSLKMRELVPMPRLVMFTANALEESRQSALEAGADDFLSKPFQKEELYRIIERQLGIHFIRGRLAESVAKGNSERLEVIGADLAQLSASVRERLLQAAISLSPAHIAAALQEVAVEDGKLGEALKEICADRRYRSLWQLLGILEKEE